MIDSCGTVHCTRGRLGALRVVGRLTGNKLIGQKLRAEENVVKVILCVTKNAQIALR